MLDVLCPLLTEADFISNELLDIILINIVDPYKTQRKNAASLARDLIIKTSSTLEPYIQQFFNQGSIESVLTHHISSSNIPNLYTYTLAIIPY